MTDSNVSGASSEPGARVVAGGDCRDNLLGPSLEALDRQALC